MNIDNERIKKVLGDMEEKINWQKENGCKLLDCKVIDNNIELRLENIKLKKIAEKLAYYTQDTKKLIKDCVGWGCTKGIECTECIIDWARKEVEK